MLCEQPIKKFKEYAKKFIYPRVSPGNQLLTKSGRNSELEIGLSTAVKEPEDSGVGGGGAGVRLSTLLATIYKAVIWGCHATLILGGEEYYMIT